MATSATIWAQPACGRAAQEPSVPPGISFHWSGGKDRYLQKARQREEANYTEYTSAFLPDLEIHKYTCINNLFITRGDCNTNATVMTQCIHS